MEVPHTRWRGEVPLDGVVRLNDTLDICLQQIIECLGWKVWSKTEQSVAKPVAISVPDHNVHENRRCGCNIRRGCRDDGFCWPTPQGHAIRKRSRCLGLVARDGVTGRQSHAASALDHRY